MAKNFVFCKGIHSFTLSKPQVSTDKSFLKSKNFFPKKFLVGHGAKPHK